MLFEEEIVTANRSFFFLMYGVVEIFHFQLNEQNLIAQCVLLTMKDFLLSISIC